MFIDRPQAAPGTPLGMRCCVSKSRMAVDLRPVQIKRPGTHPRTWPSKGVRNLQALENYKHHTPPE
jgi:hypothetical protein